MKILKVFGVVVGIHLFALVLIFANPGCTSTSKPVPTPADTVTHSDAAPAVISPVTAPMDSSPFMPYAPASSASTPPPAFNPDAPAVANVAAVAPVSSSPGFRPTRPGTTAASSLLPAPVSDVTPATTYAVKPGDSLWSIGKRNNITPADLAAANNLKVTATLHEGQKIVIPNKTAATKPAGAATATGGAAANRAPASTSAPSAAPKPAAAVSGETQKHTVQPGETLGTIAKMYGVSQSSIAVANNITNPARIDAGKELVIPGAKTAAPAATKAVAPAEPATPTFNIMNTPPPASSGASPFPTAPSSDSNSPFPSSPKSN